MNQTTPTTMETEKTPKPAAPPPTQADQLALLRRLASIEGELPPPGPERRKAVGRFYARAAADFDTYRQLMQGYVPADSPGTAEGTEISGTFITEYLEELAPRNPIERMLAVQTLWQHARIGTLMQMFADPSNRDNLPLLTGIGRAIDDALTTARRQAQAWTEIRTPRPTQVFKPEQMNVAHQQIVSNSPRAAAPALPPTSLGNEQGLTHGHHAADPTPPVPALPERAPIAPGIRSTGGAVALQHGAEDAAG